MGSSSSKQDKHDIHNNTKSYPNTQIKTDVTFVNFPKYDRNITSRDTRERVYLHNQVKNPVEYKNPHKPFNDLSKSGTSNSSANFNIKHDNSYLGTHKENILADKKIYSPENQTIYIKSNKPKKICAQLSLQMLTKDNFPIMWFSWKNEFLTYMKSIDQTGNKEKWGIMLLNRLGPNGQEIYRNFNFDDNQVKEDIDVLLEKFDHYCTFACRKKEKDEDIDMYVNNLKVIASNHTTNTDEVVKEKILEEIDTNKFTNSAKNLIPEFLFSSNIKFLTLQEIMYIWMKSENVNFKQNEKIDNNIVRNCGKCSLTHIITKCPAYGKQCNKCGNMNHHWSRCPSQFRNNCSYCGDSHFYRQCPAYMNECSNCRRLHHFNWKCDSTKILNCNYCGLTHIASRYKCTALNHICHKCSKRGHFPSKCWKK